MAKPDYVIAGAGFAGATCARVLADGGKRVLLCDQRNHIGGNSYDYTNRDGVLVHKYGAHIFHTNSAEVVEFLSRFTDWRPYTHKVLASVNGQFVPMPINRTTLRAFNGNKTDAIAALITPYTRKQWGPYADDLSPSVLARIKARDSDDDRYFTDTYQLMPREGYTKLFERMLDHPSITVDLNHAVVPSHYPKVPMVWTGPIDEYFDFAEGPLPYRSATFDFRTYDAEYLQSVGCVNFPDAHVPFTRAIEFKHLTGQVHPQTTIAFETPQAEGEPFWPVPTDETAALYQRYKARAARLTHVHFLGRLGTYQYFDQHQVVAQALTLATRLLKGGPYADAAA